MSTKVVADHAPTGGVMLVERLMAINRIFFENNPWPEGHPVKSFKWGAKLKDDYVWFDFHLESADYYSERDIEDDEDLEYETDWAAPIVWGNYHNCTLSTNYWHDGGFKVCKASEYSPEFLDGLELSVDMHPEQIKEWDELAFHIYLLGHDAAACHKIRFVRNPSNGKFSIFWVGRIAQAYIGDYEFRHNFKVNLSHCDMPKVEQSITSQSTRTAKFPRLLAWLRHLMPKNTKIW
ncbi:hypothetical protein [Microbulbifer agarilyticus]|uniref:hypothetical protein n=1 Tax=Microbulbifer agarilyticus TaxID=260552 RepID=UPI001CD23B54|nr:hypothetical protein [Microbulbifer agarilyticus]MCA0894961.1 hypothetical protein [Microbulbifer agarilyticus]